MKKWHVEIEGMPEFDKSMERIEAWFAHEIVDRAPIRFFDVLHPISAGKTLPSKQWATFKDMWYDFDYILDAYLYSLEGRKFYGESFPIFYPNLGPGIYASFYGGELNFGQTTSWTAPILKEAGEAAQLKLDWNNRYLKAIDEFTDKALECCDGKFLVGYTDLHPGADCVADWIDPQELCFQLMDNPEGVKIAVDKAEEDFEAIYSHFDDKLKASGQLSVSWLGVPSFGRMHIPSCDFSSMISGDAFREFCLPAARREMTTMTYNVWHLDGPGCARHVDDLLAIKEIQAIQWVQGSGDDWPILQWIPLLKKIQTAGKSLIVTMGRDEFEPFLDAMSPKGIFISTVAEDDEDAKAMIEKVEKWSK